MKTLNPTDRVQKAALEVLKEYESKIRAGKEQGNDTTIAQWKLRVRDVPKDKVAEVRSALTVFYPWAPYNNLNIQAVTPLGGSKDVMNVEAYTIHPIGPTREDFLNNELGTLATKLADGGINYPGSEQYRTKELS